MSNLQLLAQTTSPTITTSVALLLWLLPVAAAFASARLIVQRRWYTLPPVPEGSGLPGTPLLAGTMLSAIALFLGAVGVTAHFLGLTAEQLKERAGMREITLYTPLAHLITAVFIVGMLWPYLPRALHWADRRVAYFRQAVAGYLLALPWVILTGLAIQIIVQLLHIEADKQHLFFEIWSGEEPGLTSFKLAAMFSAVLVAPVVEEIFFRGVVQRLAHQITTSPAAAIVLASLAFAATHSPWTTQPSIFVLSLFLGWLYFRSGSILVPILMHAIFNAIQFIFFFTFDS